MGGDETITAIRKHPLVDQVCEMLHDDIITLRCLLGGELDVSELWNELGVGCTPIQEAIDRFQQGGLVVYEDSVGVHTLDLDQYDIIETGQLAVALHCATTRLAIAHGGRAITMAGLEKYLKKYRWARNVQNEVTAVNRFVETFCVHYGSRRPDASIVSIQSQRLLLQCIYADYLTEHGSHAGDFESMLEVARKGDAEEVRVYLQRNTDRYILILMEHVLKEEATR